MKQDVMKYYEKCKARWISVANRRFGICKQDLEDIYQETFVEALNGKLPRKRQVLKFWLERAFFSKCKNFLSKKVREREMLKDTNVEGLFDEPPSMDLSDILLVFQLSRYWKELELRYVQQKGVREISEELGISYENAKKRIQRGKEEVRKNLSTVRSIISMLE